MALLSGLLASREDWEILISHLQHLHTFHEFLLRLVIILTELVTRVVQNSKCARTRNHSQNKFFSLKKVLSFEIGQSLKNRLIIGLCIMQAFSSSSMNLQFLCMYTIPHVCVRTFLRYSHICVGGLAS